MYFHLVSNLSLQNPSAQTPTPPPFNLINFPFSSAVQWSFEIHRGCFLLLEGLLAFDCIKKKKKKISEMILLDLWNLEMWISASAWLVLTVVNKNNNIIFKLLNYLGIFAWASNSDNIEFSPRTCSWPKYSFIFSGLAFSARGWFELIGFCWLLLVDVEIFSFAFDVPGSVFFTFNLVVKLSRLFDFNRFVGLDIFSSSFSTSAKSTCSFLFFLAESGATGSEMERKYKI